MSDIQLTLINKKRMVYKENKTTCYKAVDYSTHSLQKTYNNMNTTTTIYYSFQGL